MPIKVTVDNKKTHSGVGLRKLRGGPRLLEPCPNCKCRRYAPCTCTKKVREV